VKEMRIGPGHRPEGTPPPELDLKKLTERMKNVELGKPKPETAESVKLKLKAEAEKDHKDLTKDEEKDLLKKTLELADMLNPRRHLEYEVIEEADIVQVQVVNTDDGTVVRKIPSDEIVKLVEQIRSMLADRFEVEA